MADDEKGFLVALDLLHERFEPLDHVQVRFACT
jgi:hypothetical protein